MNERDLHAYVEERADGYALGVLDEAERATLDTHVVGCAACSRALGEAEADVVGLIPRKDPSPQLAHRIGATLAAPAARGFSWRPYAVAAAFALLLLGALVTTLGERNQQRLIALQSTAMTAMLHGHFVHAQFAPLAAAAPLAKVVFAHEATWLYVIVEGDRRVRVVGEPGNVSFGVTAPFGSASTLFVPSAPGVRNVLLFEGKSAIERATILH